MTAAGIGATTSADVVRTAAEAAAQELPPLVVLEPLEGFLDGIGIGGGPVEARPIGDGHSNVTYLLRRDGRELVLRRPPRPPIPPSAHDVIREARILRALHPAGARVPAVIATCEDPDVIGAPFCLMEFVDGAPLEDVPFLAAAEPSERRGAAEELVDALVEVHAADWEAIGLGRLARPDGFLERQLRRFGALAETNATRPLPRLDAVTEWLGEHMPATRETTIVHGDYRAGNVLFAREAPPRALAVLDWELSTLGDPLADVGYLLATYAETPDPADPMLVLSAVTTLPGFPTRRELAQRYAERSGRPVDGLRWYMVLALWRSAIFLEGSYKRHLAGTTDDPFFAGLGTGVPHLADRAWALAQGGGDDLGG